MRLATIGALAATHALGAAGGFAAFAVGIPLPFLIGSLVTVAALSIAGAPVATARPLRNAAILVLLTGVGLTFTPEAGETALRLMPAIVFAAIATVAIACAASLVLARVGAIDRTTAFFACVPGGPAEMSVLGSRVGADTQAIAICQLLRIVTLVVTIPPALTVLDMTGDRAFAAAAVAFEPAGFVATLALSTVAALALVRLGIATAFLIAPLGVGILLGVTEAGLSSVPMPLMMAAQVFTGAYLGGQFRRSVLSRMRRFLPAAVTNVLVVTAACAALGYAIHFVDGEDVATMILATAPGSITEMSVTAQALGLNVPVVTAFHVMRIVIVIMLVTPAFVAMQRLGLIVRPGERVRQPEPAE